MNDMIEIRWHGRGGQGAKTASLLLADAAFNTGKYIQGFPEYGPERMGAPITAYNRISNTPIRIHSNIYESIEHIKKSHPKGNFLAIDACLGSKTSIGNIQIREGPILPGKGVGKKLPQIGHYSIVGIVDKIDENNRFSFNSIRLSFILELAEIISLSLLLST